ncbi:MAG: protein kinase [Planctomycetia bacterium]|nr:protein kinase [Planctomycetia bacterium]
MPTAFSALPMSVNLAHRVEAFEAVLAERPDADFAQHLPEPDHPLYLPVLAELIRVDLEHAWSRGCRKRVTDYTPRFPVILENKTILAAVAFEEYRQRLRVGDSVRATEYRDRFDLDTSQWELGSQAGTMVVPELGRLPEDGVRTNVLGQFESPPPRFAKTAAVSDPNWAPPPPVDGAKAPRVIRPQLREHSDMLSRWAEATESLPAVGTEFLGFRLVEELGSGAFGRVYLAQQGDLAGRPVALKVACDIIGESHTLAQMQHTNIVPIYSFHRAGPFQAVCMPYFGRTTLAQVLQSISHRAIMPSSGKELRSTLNLGKAPTHSGTKSGAGTGSAAGESKVTPGISGEGSSSVVGPESSNSQPAPEGWTEFDSLPYVDAVLALVGQLADGLAHAHRRGILHRDLKPANVLLTDDGRPMLLDFNLAEDTKLHGSAERAMIGGTLPYMAPEQLVAFSTGFGRLDERADLYPLGVILFELLTGRHPFPLRKGYPAQIVPQMVADRQQLPTDFRARNPAITPGVESIVRKCLAADPAQRYQRAEDLREDIDRHLANLPLKHASNPSLRERARKWVRRHPRLTSSGSVAVIAALLIAVLGGMVYSRERNRDLEARGRFADHQIAFRDAQTFLDDRTRSASRLDEGLEQLRGVLVRYGVPDDLDSSDSWMRENSLRYLPEGDRARVTGDIGETFYLMAHIACLKATATTDSPERTQQIELAARWNILAERYGKDRLPRAVREQRAAIAELRGNHDEADRLRAESAEIPLTAARDLYLAGAQLNRQRLHREAVRHLEKANQLAPSNFSAWFVRGTAHLALGQDDQAMMCFGVCISLKPEFAPAWMNRAFAFFRMRRYEQALGDYDQALKLDPTLTEAYIQRADLKHATYDFKGAIEDYTRALDSGGAPVRVYFKRATAKHFNNDPAGAKADRDAGFKLTPTDEMSWVARAENRLDDPKAALADVDEALKLNPSSVFALQLKAHILAERLNRPDEALVVLNRAVRFHPDYVPARAGRGVLLARAGKRDEALRDAKEALLRDTRAPNLYQVGCIYALTAKTHPDDKLEALKLLWAGLKTGFALDIVDTDTDLAALRNDADFNEIVKDAKALNIRRK